MRSLSGGDVADAFRLETGDGRIVFAKTHKSAPTGFFTTEATGLRWLRSSDSVAVPEVLAVSDEPPVLVLEWIEPGEPSAATDPAMGRALADLHRSGASVFGREDRRPTGSRQLPNDPAPRWADFYATRRLQPLAALAETEESVPSRTISAVHDIAERMEHLVGPPEPPARLHGDLWAGNRLVDVHGENWLIDPAAFGGHREFDLAMMRLFGGFSTEVFAAYEEVHPLASGWQERVQLYQLAPLLVHAIKFGGGYVTAAGDAAQAYL